MRFVKPELKRYYLANGNDWVELKKELSVGEDKRYRTRGLKGMTGIGSDAAAEKGVKVDIEWDVLPFARVEAYLVGWSEGRAVSRQAIEALSADDFEEIDAIVIKHIELTAEEKKAKTGDEKKTLPSQ